jgi:hypothetical protein
MKANRRFLKEGETDAVSVIIGALLLLGLVVAAMVTVRVSYQPQWDADAEADASRTVERQMLAIKAANDRLVENQAAGTPTTLPLSLGRERSSFFSTTGGVANTVEFLATENPIRIQTDELLILQQNTTSFIGLDEQWQTITGSSVDDIQEVQSLRLRLQSVDSRNDGDAVVLTLRDQAGLQTGQLRVYVGTHPSGFNINIEVTDATGQELFDQGIGFFGQDPQTPFWVDVLHPDYRFDKLIAASDKPAELFLALANVGSGANNRDLSAEFAITYREASETGEVVVGGGGLRILNFDQSYSGGSLTYFSKNSRFPDQEFSLDNGALVLSQPGGKVFRAPPNVNIVQVGQTTAISLNIPSLAGEGRAISASHTIGVQSTPLAPVTLIGLARDLNFTIGTDHPELWVPYLAEQLQDANLTAGANPGEGEYWIGTGNGTVLLQLYGTSPDPDELDVQVSFKQSTITTRLEA